MSPPPTRCAERTAPPGAPSTAEFSQESTARGLDLMEHRLEALRAAVVGVGDVEVGCAGRGRVELAQQPRLRRRLRRGRDRADAMQVLAIHREQQVEVLEVLHAQLARRAVQLDPAPASGLGGAPVRRVADVPAAGARAVDDDLVLQAGLADERAHHALRGRRAADVAHADEQQARQFNRSTIIAIPIPPATHMVSSPYVSSRASSPFSSVVMIRAPVIPNGCPRAIAPPNGLSLSSSIPSSSLHGTIWAANASLISTMSMSSIVIPASFRSC